MATLSAYYRTWQSRYIVYHTRENFGRENFWRTIQVKAIGEEKYGK